ncbi:hypothetical protein [Paenibacillus oceani]|uniref:Uncharacterized protein n=1 Tax=Paenibacillus oceani TaxID=2772510 RepID=A0A927CDA5_9BACL|nr:hypothetical protein [Paenibacillus oceani]MBD2864487.1 hypothetical protein [Paenibacillus oceani]
MTNLARDPDIQPSLDTPRYLIRKSGRRGIWGTFGISAAFAAFLFGSVPLPAHAGVVDKVKDFIQLPGQVSELKEQYDETRKQLDDATNQLGEVTRQSRETIEQYREAEQRLREENERLARQNEQLAQAVSSLQNAEQQRANQSKRTWTMIWTGVGLIACYFLISRLFRLVLRSKHT